MRIENGVGEEVLQKDALDTAILTGKKQELDARYRSGHCMRISMSTGIDVGILQEHQRSPTSRAPDCCSDTHQIGQHGMFMTL